MCNALNLTYLISGSAIWDKYTNMVDKQIPSLPEWKKSVSQSKEH